MAIEVLHSTEATSSKPQSRFWRKIGIASLFLNVLLVLLLLLNSWDGKSAFLQDLDRRITSLIAG